MVLVDTNVLVYAADSSALQHTRAKALRDRVEAGILPGAVTQQILLEFFATVTGKRVATPRRVFEACEEIEALSTVFTVLTPPADHAARVSALARLIEPKGPEIFDISIAVTALSAGVHEIYTYDSSIFGRVPGITVRGP